MRYKSVFTVVYSKKSGRILREVWEPFKRLFWPLPWVRFRGTPKFESYEKLSDWFEEMYPDKKLEYCHYGKSKVED